MLAAMTALSLAAPCGGSLAAQDRSKDTRSTLVPESAMPPAGMCRVWLRDIPERQQPAPTDCATAIRTMPRDAMVLFGDLKRAAKVAAPQSSAAAAAAAALRQNGRGPRDVPSFRGTGSNNGELRSPAQGPPGAPGNSQMGRQGVVGVSTSTPAAASKAPPAKAVVKPDKP